MNKLIYTDAIHQLEVALLGSPAAQLIYMHSTGMRHLASTSQPQGVQPPHVFTTTPMEPPPSTIPIRGITDPPASIATSSSSGVAAPTSQEVQEMTLKHCWISPMLIPQLEVTSRPPSPPHPGPSDKSTNLPPFP